MCVTSNLPITPPSMMLQIHTNVLDFLWGAFDDLVQAN